MGMLPAAVLASFLAGVAVLDCSPLRAEKTPVETLEALNRILNGADLESRDAPAELRFAPYTKIGIGVRTVSAAQARRER
jgi:hypothetical protein